MAGMKLHVELYNGPLLRVRLVRAQTKQLLKPLAEQEQDLSGISSLCPMPIPDPLSVDAEKLYHRRRTTMTDGVAQAMACRISLIWSRRWMGQDLEHWDS